ncbi:MAG: prephenate/arogenate dehydrogenase family protein [Magnetovibrionaceae bacterium]
MTQLFERICFIGIGLIGSSLSHVVRNQGLASHIAVSTRSEDTLAEAKALGLGDSFHLDPAEAVADADLVMLCAPLGANAAIAKAIGPSLKPGAIVSDVGSVKACVIKEVKPHLPDGVHLVPGHPIAGTENSGPASGFPELFRDRWLILTPEADTDEAAVAKLEALWKAAGSKVERMDPHHHDKVLAITSHLPHLIAYTIVDTATELSDDLQREVIEFSASGFRDFTRIAASDPTMWRDIFLKNQDAVLEMVSRFSEDLTGLRKAIRKGDGDQLFDTFERTRKIRRDIVDAGQAEGPAVPEENN